MDLLIFFVVGVSLILFILLDCYSSICNFLGIQFKVAFVQTSWQHVWMHFRVREDSSFPSQTRSGKTACTRLNARVTPSRRGPVMAIMCRQSTTVQTLGQCCEF